MLKHSTSLFLDEVGVALQKVTFAESIVLLDDCNAHLCTDKTWKDNIGRPEDSNRRCLLQFFATNEMCIMNTFFWHKEIYKCTWYRDLMGQHSIIDFCIVSVDLFSVFNVCVKRGAELSIHHHLVTKCSIPRGLNHPRTRKQFRV